MDIIWIIIGIVLILVGIIGAIVPGIPGPIVSFAALLLMQLKDEAPYGEGFMLVMGLIAVGVTVLDYVVPIWGTKKFGGTKKGVWGSTIGLIIGIFFLSLGPFGIVGILLGPFLGAYIGGYYYMSSRLSAGDTSSASFGALVLTISRIWEYVDAYNTAEEFNVKLKKSYGLSIQLRNDLPVLACTYSF